MAVRGHALPVTIFSSLYARGPAISQQSECGP